MLIFSLVPPPNWPYTYSYTSLYKLSPSPSLPGLNLYFKNLRLAFYLRYDYELTPYLVLLNDFNFISISEGSVMISLIESGLDLPEPLRLTTGISDAVPWLNLPYGIDVEYLLFADNKTGGSPSEFMNAVLFFLVF